MSNEVQKQEYKTMLVKVQDTFLPMVNNAMDGNGIVMDEYQKICVMNAISAINALLESKELSVSSPNLDMNNMTETLFKVAALKLNATATPREVFFTLRNAKRKIDGKDVWIKQLEMGIEGDGNDALAANFGRDVETIHQYWLVRENDHFEYPTFRGIEFEPPVWRPKGEGKVIRVVYPVTKKNGVTEYLIAERHDVIRNLIAHIKQNLQNETFGKAKSTYDLKGSAAIEVANMKKEILNKVYSVGLDEALKDESLSPYISPAWKDPQSSESMIIRKMRNNIVKKIPKDYGNAYIGMVAKEETEEQRVMKVVEEQNASIEIDLDTPKKEEPQYVEAELIENMEDDKNEAGF